MYIHRIINHLKRTKRKINESEFKTEKKAVRLNNLTNSTKKHQREINKRHCMHIKMSFKSK